MSAQRRTPCRPRHSIAMAMPTPRAPAWCLKSDATATQRPQRKSKRTRGSAASGASPSPVETSARTAQRSASAAGRFMSSSEFTEGTSHRLARSAIQAAAHPTSSPVLRACGAPPVAGKAGSSRPVHLLAASRRTRQVATSHATPSRCTGQSETPPKIPPAVYAR